MQRAFVRALLILYCSVWMPLSEGQTATPPALKPCASPPAVKFCSYTALNGDCTIFIDRLDPITPPTVYARPIARITIQVINPSPFENLSLDWKSTTAVVPPDTFSAVFSALTGNLGKITVLTTARTFRRGPPQISEDQNKLLQDIQGPMETAQPALDMIKSVLEGPPVGLCSSDVSRLRAWLDPAWWKAQVEPTLEVAIQNATQGDVANSFASLQQRLTDLGKEIQTLATANASDLATLNVNQVALTNALSQRKDLVPRLAALLGVVKLIPDQVKGLVPNPVIVAFPSRDRTYQNQVWSLNYSNKLAAVAKSISAQSSTPTGGTLSGLGDTPTKQPLATLTVQFQSNPRFEVSTGLMVPLTPYHSFSAAAVATNGTVTGNVVQVTRTYTVVPMVSTNILVKDFIALNQRAAWFGSVSVGYNPATSSVEFGVGPSFSWRSIVFSGVADIGRDTQLAGGFTVGQALPANNPPKPLTTTIWSVKPAVSLSIRIPLGGGASKQAQ